MGGGGGGESINSPQKSNSSNEAQGSVMKIIREIMYFYSTA